MSFRGKRVPAGQSVDVLALAGFFHVGKFLVMYNMQCYFNAFGTALKVIVDKNVPWYNRGFPHTEHA